MRSNLEPVVLDKKEAAASLKISVRMLEKLVKAGHIAPVQVGDRVLFRRQSLEEFAQRSIRRRGTARVRARNK
jgi:excisionase family DNA binding protein